MMKKITQKKLLEKAMKQILSENTDKVDDVMTLNSAREAFEKRFNLYVDQEYPPVEIHGVEFYASAILKTDAVAYKQALEYFAELNPEIVEDIWDRYVSKSTVDLG